MYKRCLEREGPHQLVLDRITENWNYSSNNEGKNGEMVNAKFIAYVFLLVDSNFYASVF
jgi:hypothetical protein